MLHRSLPWGSEVTSRERAVEQNGPLVMFFIDFVVIVSCTN